MRYAVTAAALAATASAGAFVADSSWGSAKVVNRCSYDVYIWSIDKEQGCSPDAATKLSTGETYRERYRPGTNGGISVKISKTKTCGKKDITQLEYKIQNLDDSKDEAQYNGNYLDMSFVDCLGNLEDCPGRTDGFYLKAGNQEGVFKSAVNNEHCPVFSVNNAEEAAKVSYINWNDPQTKYCGTSQDLDLYLCGGHAPDAEDDESTPAPASSEAPSYSQIEISSAPEPTSTKTKKQKPAPVATSSAEEEFVVAAAAAVTEAPAAPPAPVIKTEVVYVTKYVDRRHEHARRHQRFHA